MSTRNYRDNLPHISHPCSYTGPDHHPLTHKALLDMVELARTSGDNFVFRCCLRRIDQGCEGMVYPRHMAYASALAVADEARALFTAHVNEPTNVAALAKLQGILAIDPELPLTEAPAVQDWCPSAHGEAVVA